MSRRPVLPFVTEFKNRSSRSSASRPSKAGGVADEELRRSFLDTGKFYEGRSQNDGGREATMRAADAIFYFNDAETPDIEASSPITPTGRVLPSLIDAEDELTVRLREADGTPRRGRKVKKTAPSSFDPGQSLAPPPVQRLAPPIESEQQIVPVGPRVRRPIQQRWVLKTELKPGETWKRHLHRAAR